MNKFWNALSSLCDRGKHSHLLISPNELDFLSIIFCIGLFVARTIKHSLGFGPAFAPSADGSSVWAKDGDHNGQLFTMPDMSLVMPLRLTKYHNQVFTKAVGAQENEFADLMANDAQLCLYLAALSEPAMLLLLAKRGCPVRPLGAVNVRNLFELLDPESCRAMFGLSNDLAEAGLRENLKVHPLLSVVSRFSGPARRVRRGIEIDVEVSIVVDKGRDSSAQAKHKAIFRQHFTMLQFMKFSHQTSTTGSKQANQPETKQTFRSTESSRSKSLSSVTMFREEPYTWAELCKDYNPIHFSPMLAKLLGQPGQLAHGNHAVGICIGSMSRMASQVAINSRNTDENVSEIEAARGLMLKKMRGSTTELERWWMEVRFRRPVVLPASIETRIYEAGNGFDIVDNRTRKVSVEVVIGSNLPD